MAFAKYFFTAARKAVGGGVVAGVAAFTAAISDGNLSESDWITIAGSVVVGAVVVFYVRNKGA